MSDIFVISVDSNISVCSLKNCWTKIHYRGSLFHFFSPYHDEDREIIDLKLEKAALITESKNFWNQGDLRKRNY